MKWLIILALCVPVWAVSAANVYITQNGAGAKDGTSLGNAFACDAVANTPQSSCQDFNDAAHWGAGAAQIGQDTVVHLSGTVNAAGNAVGYMQFQASGASGHPITLQLESGAILQSPAFGADGGATGCGGAICLYNRSFLIVNNLGTIQNTDNCDFEVDLVTPCSFEQASTGIDAYKSTNNEIKGGIIQNLIVRRTDIVTVPSDTVHTITLSGSHNSVHDMQHIWCGWCGFQNFGSGDTDNSWYNNEFQYMNHGIMYATSGANASTLERIHDNKFHDTYVWDHPSNCTAGYHNDGIHTFAVPGASIDQYYIYNNYYYGNWGSCPTGFIFIENGGSNPSHAHSWVVANEVGILGAGSIAENTNGWLGLFDGETGTQLVANNTIIGLDLNDSSKAISLQTLSGLRYVNNVTTLIEDPIEVSNLINPIVSGDHNLYGSGRVCANGNCYVSTDKCPAPGYCGSLTSWKSHTGYDSNSIQSNTPGVNGNGTLQAGSVAIGLGINLCNILSCSGELAFLAFDTSQGNTRTPVARPGGATAWDAGAFQFVSTPAPTSKIGGGVSIMGGVSQK